MNEWVWSNDGMILTEKAKYCEKILSHYRFVHHGAHMVWSWIAPGLRGDSPVANRMLKP